MKLYTEQEVIRVLKMVSKLDKQLTVKEIIQHLKPIKLLRDEEINYTAPPNGTMLNHRSFKLGAKWMRDKIKGGNK